MLKIDDDNNIYLTRGDTATLDVYITDEDGVSYVMAADDRLIFSVRRLAGKGEVLITKVVSSPTIYLDTDDTKVLSFGKYKYDIFLYNETSEKLDTFIADRVVELKDMVNYIITTTYVTRTYIENMTYYKQALVILTQLNTMLKALKQKPTK